MRSPRSALLALVLVTALTGCGSEESPSSTSTAAETPTSAEGSSAGLVVLRGEGFRIGLPTRANERTQTVKSEAGPIEVTFYSSETSAGSFVVALTPLPPNVEPDLDGAVAGAVDQVEGTLREKARTTVLGHPARAARFVARAEGQDLTVFARVVAVGGKLFQVQFVLEGEDVEEPPAIFGDVLASLRFG